MEKPILYTQEVERSFHRFRMLLRDAAETIKRKEENKNLWWEVEYCIDELDKLRSDMMDIAATLDSFQMATNGERVVFIRPKD